MMSSALVRKGGLPRQSVYLLQDQLGKAPGMPRHPQNIFHGRPKCEKTHQYEISYQHRFSDSLGQPK